VYQTIKLILGVKLTSLLKFITSKNLLLGTNVNCQDGFNINRRLNAWNV